MNNAVHRISLDLTHKRYSQVINTQRLSNGDILEVVLRVRSLPYQIDENVSVILTVNKPDGTKVVMLGGAEIDDYTSEDDDPVVGQLVVNDDRIGIPVIPQMLASPGTAVCQLVIIDPDDGIRYSPCFELFVWDNTSVAGVTSADDWSALTTAIREANDARDEAEDAAEAIEGLIEDGTLGSFWHGSASAFAEIAAGESPDTGKFYLIVPGSAPAPEPDPDPDPDPGPDPDPEPDPEPTGEYEVVDGAIAGFGETVITPLTATAGQLSSCSLQSDSSHIYGTITYTGFTYNSSDSSDPSRLILFEITEPDWMYVTAEDSILSVNDVSYLGYISIVDGRCYICIDNSENINVSDAQLVITIDIPKAGGTS